MLMFYCCTSPAADGAAFCRLLLMRHAAHLMMPCRHMPRHFSRYHYQRRRCDYAMFAAIFRHDFLRRDAAYFAAL